MVELTQGGSGGTADTTETTDTSDDTDDIDINDLLRDQQNQQRDRQRDAQNAQVDAQDVDLRSLGGDPAGDADRMPDEPAPEPVPDTPSEPNVVSEPRPDAGDTMGTGPGTTSRKTVTGGGQTISGGVVQEVAEGQAAAAEAADARRQVADAQLSGAISSLTAGGREPTPDEQAAAATEPLTEAVAQFEQSLGFDIPGEGPLASGKGLDADLGEFGGQFGRDVESFLEGVQTDILEATETGEPGAFAEQFGPEAEAAVAESRAEGFTQAEQDRLEFAEGLTEGIARTPAFPVSGLQLAKDTLDFAAVTTEDLMAGDLEDVGERFESLGAAAGTGAALAASQAVEEPFETSGMAVGSLVGTGALFGAARAVGPRTSLGTRALIQPGEEIAGFGGNRLTRAVAGERAAERLFPANEPLVFSEEAAIRAARGASRRAREAVGDIKSVNVEPRVGAGFVPPKVEIEREAPQATEPELITAEDISAPEPMGRRPSTGLGRSGVERQRELQQVGEGPGGTGRRTSLGFRGHGAETKPFALETETRQQVEGPSFDVETEIERSELEAERRIESALGLDQRQQQALDVRQEQVQLPRLTELELTRPRLDLGSELDIDTRGETDIDIETEFETEQRLESVFETEFESEQEFESEFEAEFEQESRTEIEPLGLRRDDEKRRRGLDEFDEFEKEFEEDILTPGEALGADDGLMAGDTLAGDNT